MKNIFFFSTEATSLVDIQYAFATQSCIDSRPMTFAAKRINAFVTSRKDATQSHRVYPPLDTRFVPKCSTENNFCYSEKFLELVIIALNIFRRCTTSLAKYFQNFVISR